MQHYTSSSRPERTRRKRRRHPASRSSSGSAAAPVSTPTSMLFRASRYATSAIATPASRHHNVVCASSPTGRKTTRHTRPAIIANATQLTQRNHSPRTLTRSATHTPSPRHRNEPAPQPMMVAPSTRSFVVMSRLSCVASTGMRACRRSSRRRSRSTTGASGESRVRPLHRRRAPIPPCGRAGRR